MRTDAAAVHLFVFDGLSDWEPGYAVAGINNPAFQRAPGRFRVQTVGPSRAPVVTAGGVRIEPDLALGALEPAASALLILPGGGAWDEGGNADAAEKAKTFLDAGVPVAAICGATAGLARAGLLDTRAHTSNASEYLQATGYRGGDRYRAVPAVTDGNVITASAMAPIEFAYEIFRLLDLYDPDVLEAWYALFTTRDPAHYDTLAAAAAR